jgi:hypothetical protein
MKLDAFSGIEKPISTYSGGYALFGPTFTFPTSDSQYFNLELLAGTATSKDIGLLSTLKFGYNFSIGNIVLSLNMGVAYVKVKGLESYLGNADDLNYIGGSQISFKY